MAAKKTQETTKNPDRVYDWVDQACANAPENGYQAAAVPYTPHLGTCDACQGKNELLHPVTRPEHVEPAAS